MQLRRPLGRQERAVQQGIFSRMVQLFRDSKKKRQLMKEIETLVQKRNEVLLMCAYSISFSAEGVAFSASDTKPVILPYAIFHTVVETRDYLFLFFGGEQTLILQKQELIGESVHGFLAFLEQRGMIVYKEKE